MDPNELAATRRLGYRNNASDLLNTCQTPHASGIPTNAHAPARRSTSPTDGPDCRELSDMVSPAQAAAADDCCATVWRASTGRTNRLHRKPITSSPAMMCIVIVYASAFATPCAISYSRM